MFMPVPLGLYSDLLPTFTLSGLHAVKLWFWLGDACH